MKHKWSELYRAAAGNDVDRSSGACWAIVDAYHRLKGIEYLGDKYLWEIKKKYPDIEKAIEDLKEIYLIPGYNDELNYWLGSLHNHDRRRRALLAAADDDVEDQNLIREELKDEIALQRRGFALHFQVTPKSDLACHVIGDAKW